jgi:hypothetical protein
MVLAQKRTWRPKTQNRKPRQIPTQLQPFDFWQRSPKHSLEKKKKITSSINGGAEKTG